MQKLILIFAVAMLGGGWASASDKTDAVAVVNQWTDNFNKGDLKAAVALCAADASIIDDLAPFHWRGPGASQVVGGVRRLRQGSGNNGRNGYAGSFQRSTSVGTAPIRCASNLRRYSKGKPIKVTARVTMALQKGSSGWQIVAWSWSD